MVQETAPNDWSINFLTHDLHVFQKEKSCIAEFTMNIDILVKRCVPHIKKVRSFLDWPIEVVLLILTCCLIYINHSWWWFVGYIRKFSRQCVKSLATSLAFCQVWRKPKYGRIFSKTLKFLCFNTVLDIKTCSWECKTRSCSLTSVNFGPETILSWRRQGCAFLIALTRHDNGRLCAIISVILTFLTIYVFSWRFVYNTDCIMEVLALCKLTLMVKPLCYYNMLI